MKQKKITNRTLITAKMLRDANACEHLVKIFEKEWPKGTRITQKACLRVGELSLDLDWFVRTFLPVRILNKWHKKERSIYYDRNITWTKYARIAALIFYQVVKEAK